MIVKEKLKESTIDEKKFLISPKALEIKYMFPWSRYDDLQTNNKRSTKTKNVKTPKINLKEAAFFCEKEKAY